MKSQTFLFVPTVLQCNYMFTFKKVRVPVGLWGVLFVGFASVISPAYPAMCACKVSKIALMVCSQALVCVCHGQNLGELLRLGIVIIIILTSDSAPNSLYMTLPRYYLDYNPQPLTWHCHGLTWNWSQEQSNWPGRSPVAALHLLQASWQRYSKTWSASWESSPRNCRKPTVSPATSWHWDDVDMGR